MLYTAAGITGSTKVVFVTIQMGISMGKLKPEDFKSKVETILKTLQFPVQVSQETFKHKNEAWKQIHCVVFMCLSVFYHV
ncbi:unnamed protein product [Oncorhynchus mykiss]|uniref:Uncharacterized protein n=1 Tax=Oncorhynchus mykiss TaxID=8022 RepID=A0A060Y361_ONCMY|nr:unnamed protein product [Oncorhynchus mykiss]